MGYSYVYPPLSKSASSKIDLVDPLPTSPPGMLSFKLIFLTANLGGKFKFYSIISAAALPPKVAEGSSFLPSLNPQKEFQSFLDNIGNKFSFSSRRQPIPDLTGRPSSTNVKSIRKRPAGQGPRVRRPNPNNVPRRRMDQGTQRNFLAE